jgi:hypothetical protein
MLSQSKGPWRPESIPGARLPAYAARGTVLPLDPLRGRGRLPTPTGVMDPGSTAARSVGVRGAPAGAPATRPSLPCAERGEGEMRETRVRRER